MNNNSVFLPLWSWGVVAVIIGLVLLSAYPVAAVIEDQKYSNAEHLNLTRLMREGDSHPIIALGTSLTRNAFFYDSEMERKLKEHGVNDRFVRITASGARKSSYEGALPKILEASPRIVLIELEMLLVDQSVRLDATRYSLMQNVQIIYAWLKYTLLGIAFQHPETVFSSNYGIDKECKNIFSSENPYPEISKLPQQQLTVYDTLLSQPWLSFIEAAHRNGTKVVIVELGRSNYASSGLTPQFLVDYADSVQKLQALPSLSYLRFPGPYTAENYCDLAHLNEQGSANFVNWVTLQVRSILHD